jgi:acetyltransferase-like isoleucine patch superfamily enzyme
MKGSYFIYSIPSSFFELVRRAFRYLEKMALMHNLASCGKNLKVSSGCLFEHPEYIKIGDNVEFNTGIWVSISNIDPRSRPLLDIGNGVYIGRYSSFSCVNSITIEDEVMISDRVFIGDALHVYKNTDVSIIKQPMISPGKVRIGRGSWVGVGAVILPNVSIGRNCVIGANSVVTSDVADFHVVAGVPAKIIKKINND